MAYKLYIYTFTIYKYILAVEIFTPTTLTSSLVCALLYGEIYATNCEYLYRRFDYEEKLHLKDVFLCTNRPLLYAN